MDPSTRSHLFRLVRGGGARVIVFDVDELRVFAEHAGETKATEAVAQIRNVLPGDVREIAAGRFLIALAEKTYDEAVSIAERTVDDVRALAIPFGSRHLSVTVAVVEVMTSTDVDRFTRSVDALLLDGKSTGGDAIIAYGGSASR